MFYHYNEEGNYKVDEGTEYEGVDISAGGWDLYRPKSDEDRKFRIKTSDGDVIMLKVWRKSDLNKLITYINKKFFTKGELSIQPDK